MVYLVQIITARRAQITSKKAEMVIINSAVLDWCVDPSFFAINRHLDHVDDVVGAEY